LKTFLNDTDGLSIKDLEKIITCVLFVLGTIAVLYMFVFNQFVDVNMNYFVLGLGTLFVLRKIMKYNLEAKTIDYSEENTNTAINTNTDTTTQG
jgi:hypothetical protein